MPLSDAAVRNAKPSAKPRKLSDGGGLHLLVTPTGSRHWRLQYRFEGKQKMVTFGSYPVVSLTEARERRDAAKRLLAQGQDPRVQARLTKLTKSIVDANTFNMVADEYLAKMTRERRADATMEKTRWLLDLARVDIGERPIADIKPIEVLAVLRKVELRGRYETARRLRSTMGTVFRYAIATVRAEHDPTYALRGALTTPTVKPRAAITDAKAFGGLLRAIDGFDGQPVTLAALRLMALLFPRPGELRLAEWREFNLEKAEWVLPASRTKMRRPHRSPLPTQAVAILRDLRQFTGTRELALPSVSAPRRPMSENTLNAALRRLGYGKDEVTAHGFRATASTLLNESGLWHADAIERQLGHVENNDVRRAYARGEHWEERVRMMQWWADRIDEMRSNIDGKVGAAVDTQGEDT
ncbi:DUF4102 domain-containing protein [Ancylobacter aquaticus]|nr:DUF4102 domain-containing protein [Ancylobacter aquaticus]